MFSRMSITKSTEDYWGQIDKLKEALKSADAVVIGAGAGLSTSAGFVYSGERFRKYFSDFENKYGFHDMYSGAFCQYDTPEEHWAYWSRFITVNRYMDAPKPVYEDIVRQMMEKQKDMKVPSELMPICPHCKKPMTMNLRSVGRFVEDEGWHKAAEHYEDFLCTRMNLNLLFLELGVGYNTPGIIKYPFWQLTAQNPNATYACVNYREGGAPKEIADRSILINADAGEVIGALLGKNNNIAIKK